MTTGCVWLDASRGYRVLPVVWLYVLWLHRCFIVRGAVPPAECARLLWDRVAPALLEAPQLSLSSLTVAWLTMAALSTTALTEYYAYTNSGCAALSGGNRPL